MKNFSNATKDLSQRQFDLSCKRWGFREEGFLGYYYVGHGLSVSIYNRTTRREQLRFLIEQSMRAEKLFESLNGKDLR